MTEQERLRDHTEALKSLGGESGEEMRGLQFSNLFVLLRSLKGFLCNERVPFQEEHVEEEDGGGADRAAAGVQTFEEHKKRKSASVSPFIIPPIFQFPLLSHRSGTEGDTGSPAPYRIFF